MQQINQKIYKKKNTLYDPSSNSIPNNVKTPKKKSNHLFTTYTHFIVAFYFYISLYYITDAHITHASSFTFSTFLLSRETLFFFCIYSIEERFFFKAQK